MSGSCVSGSQAYHLKPEFPVVDSASIFNVKMLGHKNISKRICFMSDNDVIYRFRLRDWFLGAQMLFVAFGSLVLVPLLTGLDSNVALFTAGVGTLIFQMCTRGRVPVFLASSFAFIAPIIYGIQTWGLPATMGGMVAAGGVYIVFSMVIRFRGTGIILRLLPPVVTGPVIIVIGLVLAPVGVNMALGKTSDGSGVLFAENVALIISMTSLAVTVLVSLLGRGFMRLVPILSGIAAGYAVSVFMGVHDFTRVADAAWFSCHPLFFRKSVGKPYCSSFP